VGGGKGTEKKGGESGERKKKKVTKWGVLQRQKTASLSGGVKNVKLGGRVGKSSSLAGGGGGFR